MKLVDLLIIISITLFVGGCSGDQSDTGDHAWKEQTDALKKAEQVEDQILKQAEQQRKSIEQQTAQ